MIARDPARAALDEAARASRAKLLAVLATRSGDITACEDALAEAFVRAAQSWTTTGVPNSPEAWLLTTARNHLKDHFKSATFRTTTSLESENTEGFTMENIDPNAIPDERLKLMFVCAHPAIDEAVRAPLMLQTVLGLDATDIGQAFLLPGTTMAQRLVRAKRKIRDARISFVLPDRDDMGPRLESVLEAIYGAVAASWTRGAESDDPEHDLDREATFLSDLLVDLGPQEAEALGLAALLNFIIARREAQQDDAGTLIPLRDQDAELWNRRRLVRAETLLRRAKNAGDIGRFQLEAAIQAVHCDRRKSGKTDWISIVQLYEGLLRLTPTMGAAVAQAAAIGEAYGPQAGLDVLEKVEKNSGKNYQPLWAARAHLLEMAGQNAEAAYDQAVRLTKSAKALAYLSRKRERARHRRECGTVKADTD